VEQKRAVERELMELKSQLEKAGFSSLSQMRYSYPYNKHSYKGYFALKSVIILMRVLLKQESLLYSML